MTESSHKLLPNERHLPWLVLAGMIIVLGIAGALGFLSPAVALGVLAALALTAAAGAVAQRRTEKVLLDEIAGRRLAEQEADAANRAKSEFLANMSHELRTPLGAVISAADLLRNANLPSESKRQVEIVNNSAEALLELINDILDFAKLEAGRLRLEKTDFRLRELVDGVRNLVAASADAKDLDLQVEIDDGATDSLHSDPRRLRQVLLNLMNNAVKFTHQGYVALTIAEEEDRLHFSVEDTGIGISSEAQKRIFETFYQAESITARRFGGSGLGLALSKELVERLGGSITFESERGVGTTFSFVIPVTPAEGEIQDVKHAPRTQLPDWDRSAQNILVVDDDATNRELARAHLEAVGYRTEEAPDGRTALDRMRRESFNAVLMDCQMPEVDGYETVRRWRRIESKRLDDGTKGRLPIVAVTAHALPGERDKCVAVGMDEYITKPFRGAELHAILETLLHPSRAATIDSVEDEKEVTAPDDGTVAPDFEERIDGMRRLGESTGRDVLSKALESYRRNSEAFADGLRRAHESGEIEGLDRTAHAFIAHAGMLGAGRLVTLARETEARILEGRSDDGWGDLLSDVETGLKAFESSLETVLDR